MMASSSAILLDTHAIIWWLGSPSLRPDLDRTLQPFPVRLVSPISLWEISMLVERGRIALDRPTGRWAEHLVGREDVQVVEITPRIAVRAGQLQDFHGDPADRILAATAIDHGVPLATKDRRIQDWSDKTGHLACAWD